MKTRMKITIVTIVGMCMGVTAQNEVSTYFQVNADNGTGYVASKIFLKSHNDVRGTGLFTLGQTNNWFIGNPYTDHANSFMIGVSNKSNGVDPIAQKQYAKFYLNKDGEVGIGTTSPSAKLQITDAGTSSVTTLQLNDKIKFRGDGVVTWGATSNHGTLSWEGDEALIGAKANKNLSFLANGSKKMIIKTNGDIGIGTSDPKAKLDIRNGHLYVGDEVFSNPASWGQTINIDDNVHSRILIEERQTGVQTSLWSHTGGNAKVGTISDHDFGIMTKGIAKMTIKTNGNVGIGTTDTKGFKLGVNGKIATTEVKVASYANWSDFVFEKDYNLPTLTEVEKHIKEKGHLKDIPSAKEVEKNGFFLGEMDAKLLQKIEELTLYTLEQEKRLNEKDKEVKQLKEQSSKIEKLEKENIILKSLLERVTKLEKAIEK